VHIIPNCEPATSQLDLCLQCFMSSSVIVGASYVRSCSVLFWCYGWFNHETLLSRLQCTAQSAQVCQKGNLEN